MRIQNRAAKWSITLALALGAAGAVHAARQGAGPGPMRGRFGQGAAGIIPRLLNDPELQKTIGLSQDQLSKLQQVLTSFRNQSSKTRDDVRSQGQELRSLIADASSSRAQIEKQANALAKSVQELRRQRLESLLDARDILTVDQRTKLHEQMQKMRGQSHGGWHRGWGGSMNGDEGNGPSIDDGTDGEDSPPPPDGH